MRVDEVKEPDQCSTTPGEAKMPEPMMLAQHSATPDQNPGADRYSLPRHTPHCRRFAYGAK